MISLHNNQGWTLIELLTVVAIIGMLAIGIMMVTATQFGRARDATRIADLKDTQVYLERYYIDHGAHYPSTSFSHLTGILNNAYPEYDLNTSDPTNLSYTYGNISGDDGTYCLCAKFERPGEKTNASDDQCTFVPEEEGTHYCLVNKQ